MAKKKTKKSNHSNVHNSSNKTQKTNSIERDVINKNKYGTINIAKWIFFITPIVFFLYLYMLSLKEQKELYDLIGTNPLLTVTFMAAMLAFFCGWICKEAIKRIRKGENLTIIKIYLNILAFTQLFFGNAICSILIWIGIFKLRHNKGYKLTFKNLKQQILETFLQFLACLFIILITFLCVCFISLVYL